MLIFIYSLSDEFLRRHEEAIIAEGHQCLTGKSIDDAMRLIQANPVDVIYLHKTPGNAEYSALVSRLKNLHNDTLFISSSTNLNDPENIAGQENMGLHGIIMTCNDDPRPFILHLNTLHDAMPQRGTDNHAPATPQGMSDDSTSLSWQISCYADIDTIRDNDILDRLSRCINNFHIAAEHRRNLMIILSELYNNAVDHGLLRLPSELKQGAEGFARFYELRLSQLQKLKSGFIDISISQSVVNDKVELSISIKDSGKGFDYDNLIKNEMTDAPYGRGLIIINKLCKSLEYRGNGNEVTMIYEWPV